MHHDDIELEPGIYIVAVSGGVDSMVLLDLLRQKPGLKLVVAHFDHGIRHDSHLDRKLVQDVVARYGLPFVHTRAELGPGASEDQARRARYEFLRRVKEASGAKAIITAHHHDDMLETAIHNILRGTGRKGVSSLSRSDVIRPLLKFSKKQLQEHGNSNGIKWREDVTNQDTRYRRNYIRHKITPKLDDKNLAQFKFLVEKIRDINIKADSEIAKVLQKLETKSGLSRQGFIKLPHDVSREVMAAWLRNNEIRQFDRKSLERLVAAAKTFKTGKRADIDAKRQLAISKTHIQIVTR